MRNKMRGLVPGLLRILLLALLVFTQVGLMIVLSYFVQRRVTYIYWLLEALGIIFSIYISNKRNTWAHKMGWIMIILLLPVVGIIMYLLWGSQLTNQSLNSRIMKVLQRDNEKLLMDDCLMEVMPDMDINQVRVAKLLDKHGFPLYQYNDIKYFDLGDTAFRQIIEDIKIAKDFIFLEFFIVADGKLWDEIHPLLVAKAKEGVRIYLLYDDWGCIVTLPPHFARDLKAEGINVAIFNPVHKYLSKLYLNYRNHQKIVVIDGEIGYTGGINLADEYVNYYPKHGHWKDQALRVTGPAVFGLSTTFLKMWEIASGEHIEDYEAYRGSVSYDDGQLCQPFFDGPANNPDNPAKDTFIQIMDLSNDFLYITSPYVVIDTDVLDSLGRAASSGVDVRLIAPSIPDHKYVNYVTKYNYGRLIEAGVRIYEYTPGFIHSKMIINENTGVIGSINLDYRSFYLHYELGIAIYDERIISKAKEDFMDTLSVCEEITYEQWKSQPFYLRAFQMVLNLFSGLM